jgi:U-box domain
MEFTIGDHALEASQSFICASSRHVTTKTDHIINNVDVASHCLRICHVPRVPCPPQLNFAPTPQQKSFATMTMEAAVPHEFVCPITHDIMKDPLMRRCGLSYEREAIISWLYDHNNACPVTRDRLSPRDLVPNSALRKKISAWLEVNGSVIQNSPEWVEHEYTKCDVLPLDKVLCTCLVSSWEEASSKRERVSTKRSVKAPRGMIETMRARLGTRRS